MARRPRAAPRPKAGDLDELVKEAGSGQGHEPSARFRASAQLTRHLIEGVADLTEETRHTGRRLYLLNVILVVATLAVVALTIVLVVRS